MDDAGAERASGSEVSVRRRVEIETAIVNFMMAVRLIGTWFGLTPGLIWGQMEFDD